jgi:hypothetical protein
MSMKWSVGAAVLGLVLVRRAPAVRRWTVAAISVAALSCTGCGGGSDDSGTRSTESSAGQTGTDHPADPTSAPPTVGARSAQTFTFGDRDATVWRRGGDPDMVVSAFGSVWVKFADGKVQRLDPATGQVTATVDTGYSANPSCDLLGATDRLIWTCAGPNSLLAIDPRDNTADKPLRTSVLGDQTFLPWSAGKLWTIRGTATSVDGRSPDGSVATSVDLGAFCTDLAGSTALLIAMCPTDAKVVVIDPRRGAVVGEVPLDAPTRGAVADYIWAGFGAGTAQIDPATLEIVAVYDVAPGLEGAVWASDTDVWVRSAGRPFLTRIDPAEQEISATITSQHFHSGGGVIGLGDHLWATAYDDQVIARMSAD